MKPDIKLGDVAADTISGFEGVVVSKTEWLNGCVRLQLAPRKLHEGKPIEGHVFDIEQLVLVTDNQKTKAAAGGGDRPNPTRVKDP
jgi:hypothetical protein